MDRAKFEGGTNLSLNLKCRSRGNSRTGHETMDWFQIGKGVQQGCILSPWLFTIYAEYSMQNARLDEIQTGVKISGRNINYFRYANDIALKAESKEELKSFFMKVKEESAKAGFKTQHSKN